VEQGQSWSVDALISGLASSCPPWAGMFITS